MFDGSQHIFQDKTSVIDCIYYGNEYNIQSAFNEGYSSIVNDHVREPVA